MPEIPELKVSVTKASINGQVLDVISREDYFKNPELYYNNSYGMKCTNDKNQEILLPIKGQYNDNCTMPGIYNIGFGTVNVMPDEAFMDKYIPEVYISSSNKDDIKELIKAGDAMKKLDEPFITSPDNITSIPIRETDQPEMRGLKMALNAKNIDIDRYAGRFGDNFPNDKRQLKNGSATLKIIKRFCENCDMEAVLTFRDKASDVPNPMHTEITVSLTDFIDDEDVDYDSSEDTDE